MQEMKDTRRALVRIGYDGRVHKTFRGHQAQERFQNEIRVLRYLAEKGCDYVPQVIEAHENELRRNCLNWVNALVTTIDAKDCYTKGHSERVAVLARRTGAALGLDDSTQQFLQMRGEGLHPLTMPSYILRRQ